MERWQRVAGALGVGLLFVGDGASAIDLANSSSGGDRLFDFDIPAQPLRSAAETFARLTGGDTYVSYDAFEACSTVTVGPLVGRLTARDAWLRLTAPICAASGVATRKRSGTPVYMVDHPWVLKRDLHIPEAPLTDVLQTISEQFGNLLIEHRFLEPAEKQRLVGPITGSFNPEEALQLITEQVGSGLQQRPLGPYAFLLASSAAETSFKFRTFYGGAGCSCRATKEGPLSETVLVEKTRLANAAGVVSYTRRQIEATGASTLAEFFRYLSQNGSPRPAGYDASGAQYADFRGLGRDTHLVTINGRRTLPSANNITSSAFDLNTIPLPAVERVDVHVDSASMQYGADAIAGSIDIVTRREIDAAAVVRYATASGGAEERRATLSFGHRGSAGRFAAVYDHFQLGDLLGRERSISRDQDYFTRYKGTDYRTGFAIRSLDGSNLPGLNAPLAGLPETRKSDQVSVAELTPGSPQMISLSKFQSLIPAGTRESFVAAADYTWRGLELSADVLLARRESVYQYYPATASGIVGPNYPGNPFAQPVWIDALLTGASSMEQHVASELQRWVFGIGGSLGSWNWRLSAIHSDESAEAWVEHMLRPPDDPQVPPILSSALDVLGMNPGAGRDLPASLWADRQIEPFSSFGRHWIGSVEGDIGLARLQLGVEHRAEAMQFSSLVGLVERDVVGGYAHLGRPLVRPEMNIPGMSQLTVLGSVRHDSFSDGGAVTRRNLELQWDITDRLLLRANVGKQYRPASLFELKLPEVKVPVLLYDALRQEAVAAMLVSGGNPELRPTSATSTNISASFTSPGGFEASVNYFSIRLRDRISVLPLQTLLAAEDRFPTRVVRQQPSVDDLAAGRPGPIVLVDTKRDNAGRLFTRGLDLSLSYPFRAGESSFTPRLEVTRIDAFRYSDSLTADAPMIDRVGHASEQGTIVRWRGVASLEWQRGSWGATTYLRHIPSYDDIDGSHIGSQSLLDMQVWISPHPQVIVTFGATDLTNTSPHFAMVGAATGYDVTQWDVVGRKFMLTAKVSL